VGDAVLLFYMSSLETDEERLKMAEIYEMYEPLMLKYSLSILKDKGLAEDAVHDAFVALIKNKEKYFSVSCNDLRVPIVIITKNKCFDILKKANLKYNESLEDYGHMIDSESLHAEEQIVIKEEYETLRKYISRLDDQSRQILEMRYILELSHKEIGMELNLTPSHVNTKIVRAKAKIRKLVDKGG